MNRIYLKKNNTNNQAMMMMMMMTTTMMMNERAMDIHPLTIEEEMKFE